MVATLLSKTLIAAIVLILIILTLGRRTWQFKAPLALFFLLYFADNLLLILANMYPGIQIIPNHIWEGFLVCGWSGKLYSIIFTLLLIFLTRRLLSFREAGVTLRQKEGSLLPAILVVLALAVWSTWIGIRSPKGKFDLETLVYLAIMPGINEELVYRGYLQGLLNKILLGRISILGAPIGWGAIITSILFGLLHGFGFNNDLSLHIDTIALVNSTISGLIFAWLRERTGSLLMPIVAHGLEDFLFFLPRMV